jgi:hypothetical protein
MPGMESIMERIVIKINTENSMSYNAAELKKAEKHF